jgi:hypothetical protein
MHLDFVLYAKLYSGLTALPVIVHSAYRNAWLA